MCSTTDVKKRFNKNSMMEKSSISKRAKSKLFYSVSSIMTTTNSKHARQQRKQEQSMSQNVVISLSVAPIKTHTNTVSVSDLKQNLRVTVRAYALVILDK